MSRAVHHAGIAVVLALTAVAAWRIVATRVSDWLATTEPQLALQWDANNPGAWLALSERQLAAADTQQAATDARRMMRSAPLQADGFGILARAAEIAGDEAGARRLFAIALRRAPRDEYARAWTIGDQLQHGDYADALRNVDVLFGFAPEQQVPLVPLLTRMADSNPAFAAALGRSLAQSPPWRAGMFDDLLAQAHMATVGNVFDAIVAAGGSLSDAEAGRWYAQLGKSGRWGEAYSRWISRSGLGAGSNLPAIHNGSFESPASGIGFDWDMRGQPGVDISRIRTADAFIVEVSFLGRRVDDAGFAQTLLLASGNYRLTFRARAADLRSDKGMQWDIRCADSGNAIASSPRMNGSFDWKTMTVDFSVSTEACQAQRLTLVNPGAGGAAKVVSGQVWFGDFSIVPVPPKGPSG